MPNPYSTDFPVGTAIDNPSGAFGNPSSDSPDMYSGSHASSIASQSLLLPRPFVIAHRGGAGVGPEHAFATYDLAVTRGVDAIEAGDLNLLSDGSLGVMHDSTVDRTTDGTGNCSDYDAAGWKSLTIDASTWFKQGWTDVQAGSPPLFGEVLSRYGGKVVNFVELKNATTASTDAACKAVIQAGLKDSVVITGSSFTLISRVVSTWGLYAGYAPGTLLSKSPAEVRAAGISYYIADITDSGFTRAWIDSMHAYGIKVIGFTVTRQIDVTTHIVGKGADGYYSDQPLYAAGVQNSFKYRTTVAPWVKSGRSPIGLIPPASGGDATNINYVGSAGAFRYQPASTFSRPIIQGWACPLTNAAGTYSITIPATVDTADPDTSSWVCGIHFGFADDSGALSGSDLGGDGWLAVLRQSGTIQLWKCVAGVYTSIGTRSTAAVTEGNSATLKIDVTPTTITATRTDVVAPNTVTTTDSDNRGGYFALKCDHRGSGTGLCSFGAVTVA